MNLSSSRLLCLALLAVAPLAHAWDRPEMAKYGAAYSGPELLHVYIAHDKADGHALVKIFGINHPLDGRVFWTKIAYNNKKREGPADITYAIDEKGTTGNIVFLDGIGGGELYLSNYRGAAKAVLPLRYDREESTQTAPSRLTDDYERQTGK